MITAAITSVIVAVLAFFGIEPGLYIAPLVVAVKVCVVGTILLVSWWYEKRKKARQSPPPQ